MNKLIILGAGPSVHLYKYEEGDLIWCPFSMKDENIEKLKPLYFEMHSSDNADNNIINQNNYPLNAIIDRFNSSYFTNSISYMIAYALFTEVAEEIEIHGVDMIDNDEYINQRGSVMYWIGRAEGLGIKVHMPNQIMNPFLYGYDEEKKNRLKAQIDYLKNHASIELNATKNEVTKNQYLGFIHALNILRMLGI